METKLLIEKTEITKSRELLNKLDRIDLIIELKRKFSVVTCRIISEIISGGKDGGGVDISVRMAKIKEINKATLKI